MTPLISCLAIGISISVAGMFCAVKIGRYRWRILFGAFLVGWSPSLVLLGGAASGPLQYDASWLAIRVVEGLLMVWGLVFLATVLRKVCEPNKRRGGSVYSSSQTKDMTVSPIPPRRSPKRALNSGDEFSQNGSIGRQLTYVE